MPMLKAVAHGWYRVLQVAITLLMAALVVPVTMQILSRYTGLIPRYIWTEEIARFCFVWIIMIGAMIGVRDGSHFDVDVLPAKLSPRVQAAIRLVGRLGILAVAVIFMVYGWQFVRFGWHQTSEIAELPMLWMFVAWPLAGITWVLFLGEQVLEDVRALRGEAA